MDLTDTANIVVGNIPAPCSHRVPFLDSDLHFEKKRGVKTRYMFLWQFLSFASFRRRVEALNVVEVEIPRCCGCFCPVRGRDFSFVPYSRA